MKYNVVVKSRDKMVISEDTIEADNALNASWARAGSEDNYNKQIALGFIYEVIEISGVLKDFFENLSTPDPEELLDTDKYLENIKKQKIKEIEAQIIRGKRGIYSVTVRNREGTLIYNDKVTAHTAKEAGEQIKIAPLADLLEIGYKVNIRRLSTIE